VHEKLIRDGIPALAAADGRTLPLRTADPSEMAQLLGLKLVEETHEVLDAIRIGRPQDLLDELADLQTVVDELGRQHGLTKQAIEQRAAKKLAERGGFAERLVLQNVPIRSPRLHAGGSATLMDALRREFEACAVARIAVAFVMNSGLDLIEGPALAALLRGAKVKLLTTDYLGVTEPEAMMRLTGWHGRLEARVFSHPRRSFHPKAYLFERTDGSGRAFIGSANLSRMGLMEGVEWTWTVLDVDAGQPMHELTTRFEELFIAEDTQPLSPGWIQAYIARRVVPSVEESRAVYRVEASEPREVQKLALQELERLRNDGERKALVVAATGLGKTYLAAFDANGADKVLFIAHREELLKQAAATFRRVYPGRSCGFLVDGKAELDCELVFASIQTLSRPEHLANPLLSRFDYVVIDEFHHAAANSYQRVLQALAPRFLLGLTATPYRGDNRDILDLCDGNLAYQVGLFEAITFGWLVPFRYHGVADVVAYTDDLLTTQKTYDTAKLTLRFNTPERADVVVARYQEHASRTALGFCVSIAHADFMAERFTAAGIAAASVHSGPGSMDRAEAINALSTGKLRVLFTVDLFNEGVDIPAVDLVMFLRPTESMTVFLQQLGRGLRLHEGKAFLTALDFIGNYRNAHYKLPFLAGQDLSKDQDPVRALQALTRWQIKGNRPPGIPDGVEVLFEAVTLDILRETLQRGSPRRQMVLADLSDLAERLGRRPTLLEWQRMGRYSFKTAKTELGVDRWHRVLEAAGLLSEQDREVERAIGDFLKEIETTERNKSFKFVILDAMCQGSLFRRSIHISELTRAFRVYFSQDRYKDDVLGTDVEDALAAQETRWKQLLKHQPINAWIGVNKGVVSPYFAWSSSTEELRYIGPWSESDAVGQSLAGAVRDRATARLEEYWQRPGPERLVAPVVPTGDAHKLGKTPEDSRGLCIMYGKPRPQGLPEGWHLVAVNGKHLYGKFVEIALNVLKSQPSDSREVPNLLTQELSRLFNGSVPPRAKVRFVKQPGAAVWEIQRA
jgi:superfamily II DNA or RNA helicase/HKD family nuclease/predicted house-cleaning noncanonical NTP pyrophosphatase (MazG superfamily)